MRTLAVVNQKGGCGKTTTAINLAGVLASRGFRVMLVDLDPQGHCAAGLAIPEQRVDLHIGEAMLADDDRPIDPSRLFWRATRNLDLAPSTLRLAALEAARGDLAGRADAEKHLRKFLARFNHQYDVCLIDCSPAIGLLAFNALVAADEVIIPVETGFFSLQGASKQVNAIKSLGKRLGVAPVHRLLATMHDPASALARDLLEDLRRRFAGRVIPVVIRLDQALREAASFGQPVIEYAPESTGAADYSALADWFIEHSLHGAGPAPTHFDATPSPRAEEPRSYPPNADAPSDPEDRAPSVQVMPGIAQLTLAGAVHGKRRAETAQADALAALVTQTTASPPAADVAPTVSRAADLAARARRMQPPVLAVDIAALPTTEAKPLRPPPSAPAPLPELGPVALPAGTIGQPVSDPFGPAPRACGVHLMPQGVLFRQPGTLGSRICIAGDFNDWSPDVTPLRFRPHTGVLEALVPIDPGAYQYRLVVDGIWMPDSFNPVAVPNPFGGINSVLTVHAAEDHDQPPARPVAGAKHEW